MDGLRPWRLIRAHSRNVSRDERRCDTALCACTPPPLRRSRFGHTVSVPKLRHFTRRIRQRSSRPLSFASCTQDHGLNGPRTALFLFDLLERRWIAEAGTAVLNHRKGEHECSASNEETIETSRAHAANPSE